MLLFQKRMTQKKKVDTVSQWKDFAAKKVKSGNYQEAIQYYEEACLYGEGSFGPLAATLNPLLIAIHSNASMCYTKEAEKVEKNSTFVRKGDQHSSLANTAKLVEQKKTGAKDETKVDPEDYCKDAEARDMLRKAAAHAAAGHSLGANKKSGVSRSMVAKCYLREAVAFEKLGAWDSAVMSGRTCGNICKNNGIEGFVDESAALVKRVEWRQAALKQAGKRSTDVVLECDELADKKRKENEPINLAGGGGAGGPGTYVFNNNRNKDAEEKKIKEELEKLEREEEEEEARKRAASMRKQVTKNQKATHSAIQARDQALSIDFPLTGQADKGSC